jgi:hypothetical protein
VEITKCIPNIRFQFVITVYKVFAHSKSQCSEVLEKKKNELTLADLDREGFLVVGLHDAVEEFSKNFERTSERRTPTLPVTSV